MVAIGATTCFCSSCADRETSDGVPIMGNATDYPGTIRVVLPSVYREVVVANPRMKGRASFVSRDDLSVSNSNAPGDRIRVLRYAVAMIQLVRLKDGTIVDPVMLVESPRYGKHGGVELDDTWSVELQWIVRPSGPEHGDFGYANFAMSDKIDRYILLLEASDEKSGWRVLELEPERVAKAERIEVPDLLTLEELMKRPDHEKLWAIHLAAAKEEDQLK